MTHTHSNSIVQHSASFFVSASWVRKSQESAENIYCKNEQRIVSHTIITSTDIYNTTKTHTQKIYDTHIRAKEVVRWPENVFVVLAGKTRRSKIRAGIHI